MPKKFSPSTVDSELRKANAAVGAFSAIWLLGEILELSRSEILLGGDRKLTQAQTQKIRKAVKRHQKGEPLQYVVGKAHFYGRAFRVDSRVLIPRPETEIIVEIVKAKMAGSKKNATEKQQHCIVDIGTGSGILAITLALEFPNAKVLAGDIDAGVLQLARLNARKLGAAVTFRAGDLLAPFARESIDLLVANLPYLEVGSDFVADDVLAWEPHLALFPAAGKKSRSVTELIDEFLVQAFALPRSPRLLVLELSPRAAYAAERRWRKKVTGFKIYRESDLLGRKRFLMLESCE